MLLNNRGGEDGRTDAAAAAAAAASGLDIDGFFLHLNNSSERFLEVESVPQRI